MAITWKNVNQASNAGAADMMRSGGNSLAKGLETLGGLGETLRQRNIAADDRGLTKNLMDSSMSDVARGGDLNTAMARNTIQGYEQGLSPEQTSGVNNQLQSLYASASAPDATQQQGADFLKGYGAQQGQAVQAEQDLVNRDYKDTVENSEFADIDPSDGTGMGRLVSEIPNETWLDSWGTMGGEDLQNALVEVKDKHPGIPGWQLDRAIKSVGVTSGPLTSRQFNVDKFEDALASITRKHNEFTAARTRNRDINLNFEAQKSNIAADSANILKNYSSGVGSRNRGELLKNLR